MAAKPFKIICGDTEGFLWPSRFGPAGKSQCIKLEKSDSSWMTPIEFEKHAGKGAQHNWKRTVRSVFHNNRMLYYLIDEGILKTCQDPKHCKCSNCNTVNCKVNFSKNSTMSHSNFSIIFRRAKKKNLTKYLTNQPKIQTLIRAFPLKFLR